ncbi:NUDIX hydrolase [Falsibacillus pallidus]|uniref:ADP-ribose pyrophosphatase YjhB (NUDIX family) n=1 Tax=Falsibacillus pallidus TaxID=493781 RepID=A0A370GQK9_9BACI|nr:NUDIX hydrolase [Falsibacillus pallidus]RDI45536.1 ADP-ribose pyrophosphatase YjhB (NUDIX family) [Falsibacillus pallidus]
MPKWEGSAAVCINDEGKLLMVLQGTPEEEKKWSIPSGGREKGETFEECCIREVWEETGYEVEVIKPLHVKNGNYSGYEVKVQYFLVRIAGGSAIIQDPDELIHEIGWKSMDELSELTLAFPEDEEMLRGMLSIR